MKKKKNVVWLATFIILALGVALSFGQKISEEAKRYFDRGVTGMEVAKSSADYEAAIKEFEQAARLEPNWPDVFYNLGLAQEGAKKYGDAVKSYREYLRLAPNASDAEEVNGLIAKLESKKDRENGIGFVYDLMTCPTNPSIVPHVRWKRISMKGDYQPDWEIEYHDAFYPKIKEMFMSPSDGIFKKENGALKKSNWDTDRHVPIHYGFRYLLNVQSWDIPVNVDIDSFEYGYPILVSYPDRIDPSTGKGSDINIRWPIKGTLSIKGEIVSVKNPIRVKRTQTLTIDDVGTYVTEFIYELNIY